MSISIHALLAESDSAYVRVTQRQRDFYPRSPCGERPFLPADRMSHQEFLSTLSLRRATPQPPQDESSIKFLSTLSLRRATNSLLTRVVSSTDFYPRSPCGERQPNRCTTVPDFNFYPRSPCGERRLLMCFLLCGLSFLSTLSLRRATSSSWSATATSQHFYPRSPCGERPSQYEQEEEPLFISIHALLAESDKTRR